MRFALHLLALASCASPAYNLRHTPAVKMQEGEPLVCFVMKPPDVLCFTPEEGIDVAREIQERKLREQMDSFPTLSNQPRGIHWP